jgi:hypothetical protein
VTWQFVECKGEFPAEIQSARVGIKPRTRLESNSVKKVRLAGITTEVGRFHPHARVRAIGEAGSLDEECICYAVNVN